MSSKGIQQSLWKHPDIYKLTKEDNNKKKYGKSIGFLPAWMSVESQECLEDTN